MLSLKSKKLLSMVWMLLLIVLVLDLLRLRHWRLLGGMAMLSLSVFLETICRLKKMFLSSMFYAAV
ncbi:Uncharacterised protein [Mycobacteroides abscessus subsp. abscessus]|nr:Uncharacterised protein [Mycobacteroides abscessus subsp. abscessus]